MVVDRKRETHVRYAYDFEVGGRTTTGLPSVDGTRTGGPGATAPTRDRYPAVRRPGAATPRSAFDAATCSR